jgi:hypothetical protein
LVDEIVISLITTVASVVVSISSLAYWLGKKFASIDAKFKLIDERFKSIDERFKLIDERFKSIDEKFKSIDERFKSIDERLSGMREYVDSRFKELKDYIDKRFDEFDKGLRGYVDKRIEDLDKRVFERIERLATAFTNYQEFFVEFLTSEGIVKPIHKEFLVKEARRTMKLAVVNPLSKEEWGRLKEYLDKSEKDELTLEEADDFLELARKVVKEHGDRPEAWKLHIYATITRALLVKKHYEKERKEKEQEQERQRERQERKQDEPRETSRP